MDTFSSGFIEEDESVTALVYGTPLETPLHAKRQRLHSQSRPVKPTSSPASSTSQEALLEPQIGEIDVAAYETCDGSGQSTPRSERKPFRPQRLLREENKYEAGLHYGSEDDSDGGEDDEEEGLPSSWHETFHYAWHPAQLYRRSATETCKICYGYHDCWPTDSTSCEYYITTNMILDDDEESPGGENVEIREEVDRMLYDLVDNASTNPNYKECIPFISSYTDCTKDNICTGCKSCSCDIEGSWNCSAVQHCQVTVRKNIDHRVLVMVMENLNESEKFFVERTKRSNSIPNKDRKMTYEEIYKWWYGNNGSTHQEVDKVTSTTPKSNINQVNPIGTSISKDVESLEFDEVLSNIGIKITNYNRKKPLLDMIRYKGIIEDSINRDNENITFNNLYEMTNPFETINIVNDSKGNGTKPSHLKTKVIIDLLTATEKTGGKTIFDSDTDDFNEKININLKYLLDENKEYNLESPSKVLIKKRDVTQITENKNQSLFNNKTSEYVRHNVVLPLNEIIFEKQHEINQLVNIRDNLLLYYMQYYNNSPSITNFNHSITENNENTYLSIYKVEIATEKADIEDFRRRNIDSILDKYMLKVKRDIFEVLKDIAFIHKLTKGNLPNNIKILVRAMKYYLHNQRPNTKNINHNRLRNYRRQNTLRDDDSKQDIKDIVIHIFQIIDKNMPESNALRALSGKSKLIIKRIVKQYCIDDETVVSNKVRFNITNDLKNIGSEWKELADKIVGSPPADQLHRLKQLHLNLIKNNNKMTRLLELIDFALARRMMNVDEIEGEGIMLAINDHLGFINDKVQKYILYQRKINRHIPVARKRDQMNKPRIEEKKKSFLKHVKEMIKNSKNEILRMFKRKVPKLDIINEIAKKQFKEVTKNKLSEYEKSMRNWQEYFKTAGNARPKRELKKYQNRIKNIIPKYLRGKLNPAIIDEKITRKYKSRNISHFETVNFNVTEIK